ncbi:negative regulator of Ofd1/Enhancer of translation termination 1 [Syncephalis fuscata]|nr:negative regulator of Ofd1/Enhancer of translation termination 1 [Syncephalis fuscata]
MNQPQKRRPLGLKKASESKKAKQAEENQEEQTVWLQGGEEADDEVSEAAVLLKNAVAMLADDPDRAQLLLQGTVHECDRILRNTTDASPLPGRFYATYALALCELGELCASDSIEESIGFLQLADDFAQQGQDMTENQDTVDIYETCIASGRVSLSQARIILYQAEQENEQGSNDTIPDEQLNNIDQLVQKAHQYFTQAIEVKAKTKDTNPTDYTDAIQLAGSLLQTHADLRDDWKGRNQWNTLAITLFKTIETSEGTALICQSIGAAFMSQANWWLERQDDDDEDDEDDEAASDKDNRSELYTSQTMGRKSPESITTGSILVQLAECSINLGNVADTENDEAACYTRAAEYLQQAIGSGYSLPEQLSAFLKEWNMDSGDDDDDESMSE